MMNGLTNFKFNPMIFTEIITITWVPRKLVSSFSCWVSCHNYCRVL